MSDSPATNRKAPDQLAELREQMRILKTEEKRLREGFITGALDPVGDDYTVEVESKTNARVDLNAMRQHVEESIWRPYLISKETVYVNCRRRVS